MYIFTAAIVDKQNLYLYNVGYNAILDVPEAFADSMYKMVNYLKWFKEVKL